MSPATLRAALDQDPSKVHKFWKQTMAAFRSLSCKLCIKHIRSFGIYQLISPDLRQQHVGFLACADFIHVSQSFRTNYTSEYLAQKKCCVQLVVTVVGISLSEWLSSGPGVLGESSGSSALWESSGPGVLGESNGPSVLVESSGRQTYSDKLL